MGDYVELGTGGAKSNVQDAEEIRPSDVNQSLKR